MIIRSEDSGNTWRERKSGVVVGLNALDSFDSRKAWAMDDLRSKLRMGLRTARNEVSIL
ncbi:MAG: hypothetical protein ACE5PV_15835 [Candidatus Poribacteria bacterium]